MPESDPNAAVADGEPAETDEQSQWHVLLPATIDPAGPERLESFATTTHIDEFDDREHLLANADQFDAVITRIERLDAEFIDRASNLKHISKHGVGYDNIDVDAASDNDVVVTNTPGVNSRAVAEHAITLMLAVRRRLLDADRRLRNGEWEGHGTTDELRGDTIGLFGCGDIARIVADLATGLGMTCLTYDPYVDEETLPDSISAVDSLESLLDRADVLSIHTPLTPETRHAISHDELEYLSPSGILINTARAEVVDRDALAAALESDTIAGAGLDVFEAEPPTPEGPLFEHENVILTPHIGAQTTESLRDMSVESATNVKSVFEGELPATTINDVSL
ncbi:hydroxyacid dehydrogenase [Natrialba sp. SSL1]|uniref:hydroxyacid dehydrogenase n=1 Tax=Natrialba sp. SSL1 TaxID=1869245 RepID=UPI000B1D2011|nr:hydroxyacid dehydrogenase [Natrialba sp. SSL1]